MSLDSQQQLTEEQITQQNISSGINNINNNIEDTNSFLKDDSYDKDNIIDNMPSSSEYSDPTEDGINNIFISLKNAFTSTETQTVRFYVPFSNGQYIDIPSDLVTSKLPEPILMLIQTFYWYIIGKFIIKDIAKIVEKAKSGEILDSGSDGNIKTDLL